MLTVTLTIGGAMRPLFIAMLALAVSGCASGGVIIAPQSGRVVATPRHGSIIRQNVAVVLTNSCPYAYALKAFTADHTDEDQPIVSLGRGESYTIELDRPFFVGENTYNTHLLLKVYDASDRVIGTLPAGPLPVSTNHSGYQVLLTVYCTKSRLYYNLNR